MSGFDRPGFLAQVALSFKRIRARTWLILAAVMLALIGLLVWAGIALLSWLWTQGSVVTDAGKRFAGDAMTQVEQVAPGLREQAEQWVPAGVKEQAGKWLPGLGTDLPANDVSGNDVGPVSRFPGLVRSHFARDGQTVEVRYAGGAPFEAVLAHYVAGFAAAGYAQEVMSATTNGVLHLLAMAHAVGVKLTLDDFIEIGKTTPVLADLRPSGQYMMSELVAIGGIQPLMKRLLDAGLLHGDVLTVTGKTLAENLADVADYPVDQDIIRPFDNPIKKDSHLVILHGNLSPTGAVAKITGKEGLRFEGTARVYHGEEAALAGILNGEVVAGDVIVIRYEGPRGGPGMREMLSPTSAVMGKGLGKEVALITDGRFSGGSHGFVVGHITPEAFDGGPIALVENGDAITIDAETREISVAVSDAVLAERRAHWTQPAPLYTRGVLAKYAKLVSSASEGAVTDK